MKKVLLGAAMLATTLVHAQDYEILPYPAPELKPVDETAAFKTILDPWQGLQFEEDVNYLSSIKGMLDTRIIEQNVLKGDIEHIERGGYKPYEVGTEVLSHRLKDVEVRTMEVLVVDGAKFRSILDPKIYKDLEGSIVKVETSYYKALTPLRIRNTFGFDQYFATVSLVELSFTVEYKKVNGKIQPQLSDVVYKRTVNEVEVNEQGRPIGFMKELGSSSSAGG